MQHDPSSVLERDLSRRRARRVANLLMTVVEPGESVLAATGGAIVREGQRFGASSESDQTGDPMTLVVTDRRVLSIPNRGDSRALAFDQLRGIATLPGRNREVLVLLLPDRRAFEAFQTSAKDGDRIAQAVRDAAASADIKLALTPAIGVWPARLLVAPGNCVLEQGAWVVATFVETGIQLRVAKAPNMASPRRDGVQFLPWEEITAAAVEGQDQITQRPSVGAVVAFGVLGLAARKTERRSYLSISTGEADFVIEVRDRLPVELRAELGRSLKAGVAGGGAEQSEDRGDANPDVLERIRELGELRDAGYVTQEEFERKKAELLKRL